MKVTSNRFFVFIFCLFYLFTEELLITVYENVLVSVKIFNISGGTFQISRNLKTTKYYSQKWSEVTFILNDSYNYFYGSMQICTTLARSFICFCFVSRFYFRLIYGIRMYKPGFDSHRDKVRKMNYLDETKYYYYTNNHICK